MDSSLGKHISGGIVTLVATLAFISLVSAGSAIGAAIYIILNR